MVPLRHPGFHRPRRQARAVPVGSWTPAKVKLAVSGCPRNCAEATCKDIGIICVESRLRHPHRRRRRPARPRHRLLGHVATEEEALEYVAAVMQLYREQARLSGAHLEVDRASRPREDPRRDHGRPRRPPRAARALQEIAARRAAATPGPSAPPAASCTSSRRSPSLALGPHECACGMSDVSGSTSARSTTIPQRGARAVQDAAPRDRHLPHRRATRCSRWRTAARTRAGRSARASCTAARSPARCTTGSSTSKTARRPAPTRAAPAVFPVKLENGRIYLDMSVAAAP